MKLVLKLSSLLIVAMVLVAGYRSWTRVEATNAALEAVMRREHRTLGRSLRSIAEEATREGSARRSVEHLISVANDRESLVRLDWVDGASTSTAGAEERQAIQDGELVSEFAVHEAGKVAGFIRLRESLQEHLARARAGRQSLWSGSILVALIGGLFSVVLGRWVVGKPVEKLVDKARRIGDGDLGGPLELGRSDELGELAHALNKTCEALAAANERAAHEAEARMKVLGELRHVERLATVGKLAAGLAHELGTPLSIVSGHAQMIVSGEVPAERIEKSAMAIDREATRMGRIIRQLLDFARRKGPEGATCDVVDVTKRCLLLLGPMMDKRHFELDFDAPERRPRALVDDDSLHQIVTNLLTNAVQAMPELGGKLRVAISEERTAAPNAPREPRDVVRIDVADAGSGIPDDVLPHIFEPFFTTKEVGEGTGLGLSVVYGIVQDHRGWIDVQSGGSGTTFSVFLPEAEA